MTIDVEPITDESATLARVCERLVLISRVRRAAIDALIARDVEPTEQFITLVAGPVLSARARLRLTVTGGVDVILSEGESIGDVIAWLADQVVERFGTVNKQGYPNE